MPRMTKAEKRLLCRMVDDAIDWQDGLVDSWAHMKEDPQYQVHVDLRKSYLAFQAKHCGGPKIDPFEGTPLVSIFPACMGGSDAE